MRRGPVAFRRWLAVWLGLVTIGCAGERDPVRVLLRDVEKAAEARDAGAVMERLSEAFEGPSGMRRADALASLRRYFAAYESVALEVWDVDVVSEADGARVRCAVGFTGVGRKVLGLEGLLPPSAVYRFDVRARDEGGTWRVVAGLWQEVEAVPSR